MLIYDVAFLHRAKQLCQQYDVLLIFDEVATGFGRTGHRFVADVVLPDIHGVFSRPFLDCLYAMVPYVIEEEQLVQVLGVMKAWFRRG